jgi:hypothetical protein
MASLKHLLASWGVPSPAKAAVQARAARFHWGPRSLHVRRSGSNSSMVKVFVSARAERPLRYHTAWLAAVSM